MATAADKELQKLKEEFSALKSGLSDMGKTLSQLAPARLEPGSPKYRKSGGQGFRELG